MNAKTTDAPPAAATASPATEAPLLPAPSGPASLASFPGALQRRIVEAVLDATPGRATDIWYEDKTTSEVHVIRSGMQWHLNATGSAIWQLLDGQRCVNAIVKDLAGKHAKQDPEPIRVAIVEFLLNASSYGLVDLFPEPVPNSA